MNKLLLKKYAVFVRTIFFLGISFIVSACTLTPDVTNTEYSPDFITQRSYYIGTSGYSPANYPLSSVTDINAYWNDVNKSGEVYGVHTDWKDTSFLGQVSKNTDLNLSIVLGYQDSEEWGIKDSEVTEKILNLLENPNVKYIAIGNEVNILYAENPTEFNKFVESYKNIYKAVKAKHPEVKIYTTFQYEYLRGDGFLMGSKETRNSQWEILDMFKGNIDLIGITTYPYMDYTSPNEIPDTYFTDIKKHSAKPLAITETGWMARQRYGGRLSYINELELTGSEGEQFEYLNRLTELVSDPDTEFICWLAINDFVDWKDDDFPKKYELFDSVSLKYHDGTEKKVWKSWLELAAK